VQELIRTLQTQLYGMYMYSAVNLNDSDFKCCSSKPN